MSSAVQVYISGRRHTTVHSRVIRRVMNVRGALTHQVQHQNKLWDARTPPSDHCGVQYHARRGRLLTERSSSRLWILLFPHLLDNLEGWKRFLWTLLTHANKELRVNSLGVKKDLYVFLEIFFSFFFSSICLPWCKYFGVGRFCCFISWLVTRLPWRSEKDGSLVHLYHRIQHHVNITGMKEDERISPGGPQTNTHTTTKKTHMESHLFNFSTLCVPEATCS